MTIPLIPVIWLAVVPQALPAAQCPGEILDPVAVGFLSLGHAGLGQFHAGNGPAGLFMFAADQGLLWGSILTLLEPQISFRQSVGINFGVQPHSDGLAWRIPLAISLGLGWIGVRVWSIIHAGEEVTRHNDAIYNCLLEQESFPAVQLQPAIFGDGAGIGLAVRF